MWPPGLAWTFHCGCVQKHSVKTARGPDSCACKNFRALCDNCNRPRVAPVFFCCALAIRSPRRFSQDQKPSQAMPNQPGAQKCCNNRARAKSAGHFVGPTLSVRHTVFAYDCFCRARVLQKSPGCFPYVDGQGFCKTGIIVCTQCPE